MDLLQTVKKEGSRGGVDFKWEDVRASQHRENYLGHSLMAPVGRWQKGRDLNWYAKAGDAEKTPEEIEADERQRRKDELRKIKEAEEDAMARALGLPVPDRSANTEPLGENKIMQKEIETSIKDSLNDGEQENQRDLPRDKREVRDSTDRRRHHHRHERRRSRDMDRSNRRRSRSQSRDRDYKRRREDDKYRPRSRDRHVRRSRSNDYSDRRSSRERTSHKEHDRRRSSRDRTDNRDYDRRRDHTPRRSRSPYKRKETARRYND